jgi:metal-responsive CopG/Arc/MetJ family transcriptional regulator
MSKVSVSISVDSKVIYQLEQLAEKEGKTRTEKIVEILNEWIEKKRTAR